MGQEAFGGHGIIVRFIGIDDHRDCHAFFSQANQGPQGGIFRSGQNGKHRGIPWQIGQLPPGGPAPIGRPSLSSRRASTSKIWGSRVSALAVRTTIGASRLLCGRIWVACRASSSVGYSIVPALGADPFGGVPAVGDQPHLLPLGADGGSQRRRAGDGQLGPATIRVGAAVEIHHQRCAGNDRRFVDLRLQATCSGTGPPVDLTQGIAGAIFPHPGNPRGILVKPMG